MSKHSASSTTDPAERQRKLARLEEIARRARWDATEGPEHLQSGRFRPNGEADESPTNGSGEGAIQQDDED